MPIIEVKNLTYSYPGSIKPAIKKVNLTIEKGEFIILTGPSGCGKTTLCRCFNGLIPNFYYGKLSGDIIVTGLSVREHPTFKLAQRVGFVFQNPENQLFALSVEKDVAFGLENLGLPREEIRERVEWALDVTGITNLREMAPYELSGGEQQRVAIASVIAMKPEILVLDEPTSFLDPVAAKTIFEVVGRFNKELRMTIILIEHRLDLTAPYSNRIIIMDRGQIKLDEAPREILKSDKAGRLGVSVPKVVKLSEALRDKRIKMGQVPLTADEAAQTIRRILER